MARRKRPDLRVSRIRSALTNGKHLLFEVDGRSAWMRRYRDLVQLHESDLGGEDYVSESEKRIIRRAAMLTIQCELLDQRFANAEEPASRADLEIYQRCANTLRRMLESLGLQRRQRDITPTLQEYLASQAGPAE